MDEGHRVRSVSDTESLAAFLRNSKPDLVLLDLYLGGFEGWDILADIKEKYPQMPVIIVTAYDTFAEDLRLSRAEGYVVKDLYALDKLKQKVSEILK